MEFSDCALSSNDVSVTSEHNYINYKNMGNWFIYFRKYT